MLNVSFCYLPQDCWCKWADSGTRYQKVKYCTRSPLNWIKKESIILLSSVYRSDSDGLLFLTPQMLNCCNNPGFGWTCCPVSALPGRLSSTGSADLRDETSFGKRWFYRWAQLNCNSGTDGTDGVLPGTLSPVPHLTWPPQSVEGLSGFPAGGDPYRSFKASQKQLQHHHPSLSSSFHLRFSGFFLTWNKESLLERVTLVQI